VGIRLLLLLFILTLSDLSAQTVSDSLNLQASHIRQIIITGNKRTKEAIVRRELTFTEGDTLPSYVLEEASARSRQNLINTGLFNFAEITFFRGQGLETVVHIDLTERWYLWPSPIFEISDRNFNEWLVRKDFSRTNYGLVVRQENLSGNDDILQAQGIFGYTNRFGLAYSRPFINKRMDLGLTVGFAYSKQAETSYNTTGNKLDFIRLDDTPARTERTAFVRLVRRKGLYQYFTTTADYRRTDVNDTVIRLNPTYLWRDETRQQYFGLTWSYRFDNRDYQPYALAGRVFEIEVNKTGIGLFKNEPNLLMISAGLRVYGQFAKRWYAAAAIKGRLTQQESSPFTNRKALGYGGDYIRGYDLYVINGQNFVLLRSAVRYNLLRRRVYQLPYLNSNKFKKIPITIHITGFFDAGKVEDPLAGARNPLSNSWQYGTGISLDLISYYDVVMRVEAAVNRQGERGLFLRFGAPF